MTVNFEIGDAKVESSRVCSREKSSLRPTLAGDRSAHLTQMTNEVA